MGYTCIVFITIAHNSAVIRFWSFEHVISETYFRLLLSLDFDKGQYLRNKI